MTSQEFFEVQIPASQIPQSVSIGDDKFALDSQPCARLESELPDGPMLIVRTKDALAVEDQKLDVSVTRMIAADDVLNDGFTKTIIALPSSLGAPGDSVDARILRPSFTHNATFRPLTSWSDTREGPFMLISSYLYKVYRLRNDPYGAFMTGVLPVPGSNNTYKEYDAGLIPIPSRLYYEKPSEQFPLNGCRIGVKDIYDLAGTHTSASCRAYRQLNGRASTTAEVVERLLALGAVPVGKTYTSQFASGEDPRDMIDFQCSFNPRGDGYFTTTGSSIGSAVGLAAYDWLDHTLGTDTMGSMISPASAQGIYGIRPTKGLLSMNGIVSFASSFDTPGHFSRDIRALQHFGKAWYGEKYSGQVDKLPTRLWYPSERFAKYPQSKLDIMEAFIQDIECTIGQTRTELNEETHWNTHSDPQLIRPLSEFLKTTQAHVQLYEGFWAQASFREKYKTTFGHDPYVNPMIRWKWRKGEELSQQQYDDACQEMQIFRDFVRQHILDDDSFLVLPGGIPNMLWRDDYLGNEEEVGPDLQGYGFGSYAYAVLGGLPQIAIPVGQHKIMSKVLHAKVEVPVSVILVGPSGSDGRLIDLVQRVLSESGRPMEVKVGKEAF